MIKPSERYQHIISTQNMQHCPLQLYVMQEFDKLCNQLNRFSILNIFRTKTVRGLYLWGGVGRGKTFMMDIFYDCVNSNKQRQHFHHFMHDVHNLLRDYQGERDPLEKVAKRIAKKCRVLCLDELFVSDIADAMILAELFKNMFANGVVLIVTSNLPPSGLYRNGLQREKFLPAIELIENNCNIINLQGDTDFRLQYLRQQDLYHYPLSEDVDKKLADYFAHLSFDNIREECIMYFNHRDFFARKVADSIIWFDFHELCEKPNGAKDYIEIAREFSSIILSNVKTMGANNDDAARRFIALIDECYDRRVSLIMSCEVSIESLYQGEKLKFEFTRTISRIIEMQSEEYLAKEHLA